MAKRNKTQFKYYIAAFWRVLVISFRLSKKAIIFKAFGTVINAGVPILLTYLAAKITTELIAVFNGDIAARNDVILLLVITAAVTLFQTAWSSINSYIEQKIRYTVEASVDDMMYQKFLSLEFWRYDDKYTNDLKERANKFSRFFAWIFFRLFDAIGDVVTVIFAVVALSYVSPYLSLAVFAALIPAVVVQIKITRQQLKHWNDTIEIRRKQAAIEHTLMYSPTIIETRIYGLVRRLLSERKDLRDKDELQRLNNETRYIGWRLLGDSIEAITQFGALAWVVIQIAIQNQSIGQFVFVQQLISRISAGMSAFIGHLSSIDEDFANLKDYDEFMSLPSTVSAPILALDDKIPKITFKNVSFKYPETNVLVLNDINVTIQPGDHVAIVGENGAGKSTFVKLLLGIYQPTQGQVLLNSQPIHAYSAEAWHERIGILFQDFQKFNFTTIKNNIWYGKVAKEPTDSSIETALERARALDFSKKLPKGIETIAGTIFENENGTQLSGGQWQRIAIARNMFRDAQILILDEPTSAIDAKAEAEIFAEINKEMKNKTTITISHRFSTVRMADQILVIDQGTIVEAGTHKDLMQKNGLYKEMFETQAKGYR